MGFTARIVNDPLAYFFVNVGVLALAALATALLLHRMVGAYALYFSLSPALLLYGFLNWDLLPVAISTAAVYVFLARRNLASGGLLGLGASTKLYPALFVLPFALDRFMRGRTREAAALVAASLAVWAALNIPFALLSRPEWSLVYRFSAVRPVDWGSLWYLACHDESWRFACSNTTLVNVSSVVLFAGLSLLIGRTAIRRTSVLPLWASAFPLLVVFLLSSKVYSPQYSLWLVPWFALVQPRLGLFAAFSLTDLGVFVAEAFWIQSRLQPETLPVAVLELAVVARAAVLVSCVVVYFRGGWARALTEPRQAG
jgi:uncharacterized membrane protein